MIIKIKRKPDMQLCEELPTEFQSMFSGLVVQVATYAGGSSCCGLTTSRAISGRKLKYYSVDYQNLRDVITEKNPKFWNAIQAILNKHKVRDGRVGFLFSSKEAKEVNIFI